MVIVVVAMVVGLVLLALTDGKAKGQGALCLSNLRQMARAWVLYADDNSGRLIGNLDGGDAQNPANTNRTWCAGWLDLANSPANTNTLLLKNSQLGKYVGGDVRVYRCPSDTSVSVHGGEVRPRVRSVSMNGYIGERSAPYTAGYYQFKKLSDLRALSPSKAWVFADEREDSINDGWFIVDMSGYDPRWTASLIIVNFPASYHNRAGVLSFADGHSELRRWQDGRTTPILKKGQALALGQSSPDNKDVEWLQERSTAKITNPTRF